jgi:hypothetical protein
MLPAPFRHSRKRDKRLKSSYVGSESKSPIADLDWRCQVAGGPYWVVALDKSIAIILFTRDTCASIMAEILPVRRDAIVQIYQD